MTNPYEPDALVPYLMFRHPHVLQQSEVFVMDSLSWFLRRYPAAGEAMTQLVGIADPLTWQVEVRIEGGARVDLLGLDAAGRPRVVIEGKIHQLFDAGQLVHYAGWQERSLAPHDLSASALLVLGPEWRRRTAEKVLADHVVPRFPSLRFRYISFDEVFAVVGPVLPDDPYRNWEQFMAMYHHCDGAMVAPFSIEEVTDAWELRADDYRRLVGALSETLQHDLFKGAGLPIPKTLRWTKGNYRYIRMPLMAATPAIGLFPELNGVPLAVRYTPRYTPDYRNVAARLRESGVVCETNPSSSHISVRLHLPVGASHYEMLADLRAQITRVLSASHPGLPTLAA